MMRKRYNIWQRFVMGWRDIKRMSECSINCPGCGSHNVQGGPPWMCMNCGSIWQ